MPEPRSIPADEPARQRVRSELGASFVVQAGAGTGKTTLLIDRLKALLDQFQPRELVAVTFTEKAAAELQDRLRNALELAVAAPSGTGGASPKLLSALLDLERAQLSTIHAFATTLIRAYPLELELDPAFRHADDAEEALLIDDALQGWFAAPDEPTEDLLGRFTALGGSVAKLPGILGKLFYQRDLLEGFTPTTKPTDAAAALPGLLDELASLNRRGEQFCADPSDPAWAQVVSALHSAPPEPGEFAGDLWRWCGELSKLSYTRGKKGNWNPDSECQIQKDGIRKVRETAADLLHSTRTAVLEEAVSRLHEVVDTVAQRKRELGLVSFFDQLLLARQLCDSPRVLDELRERVRRILLDEFQDTDPLQIDLAMKLAQTPAGDPEPGKLTVVGDSKQSIYRFRRADPEAYRQACAILEKTGNVEHLTQNFRSTPDILNFVNAFFDPLWTTIDQDGKYEPVEAMPDRLSPEPLPNVGILRPSEGWDGAEARVDEVRAAEAEGIARLIKDMLSRDTSWRVAVRRDDGGWDVRPVTAGDISVLMPRFTGSEFYTEALSDAGLPFQTTGGRRIHDRQILHDLLNVVKALDNPLDGMAVVGALRTAFFAVNDDELYQWLAAQESSPDYRSVSTDAPQSIRTASEMLNDLHILRNKLPVDALLLEFCDRVGMFPALSAREGDPTDLELLRGVILTAAEYARENDAGLRSFRRRLEQQLDSGEDISIAPDPLRSDRINLSTVHSAKGLEFPVVILANLNTEFRSRSEDGVNVLVNRRAGSLEVKVSGDFETAGYAALSEAEQAADEAERMRLLYVAMTRAKDHLIIGHCSTEKPAGYAAWMEDFLAKSGAWEGTEPPAFREIRLSDASPAMPEPDISGEPDYTALQREVDEALSERSARLKQVVDSLPRVSRPSSHADPQPSPDEIVPRRADITDRQMGVALHRYMALCSLTPELDDGLLRATAAESGVAAADLQPLVVACLKSDLWSRVCAAGRVFCETPALLKTPQGILRGVLDVLCEEEGGGLFIIDWKSGGEDEARHSQQLQDYRAAVEAVLGKKPVGAYVFYARSGATLTVPD